MERGWELRDPEWGVEGSSLQGCGTDRGALVGNDLLLGATVNLTEGLSTAGQATVSHRLHDRHQIRHKLHFEPYSDGCEAAED